MKLRAVALGLCLVVVTAVLAAVPKAPGGAENTIPAASVEQSAMMPITWVPEWLMEPLSRAIADATDPRDRKAAN